MVDWWDWDDVGWLNLVWLQSGDIVSVTAQPWSLIRFPAEGGMPEPPVEIKSGRFGDSLLWLLSALPDGRNVLVAGDAYGSREGWQTNVGLLDTETGEIRILIEDATTHWFKIASGGISCCAG